MLAAAEKSEFGVCGVVGGMMVIEVLAGTMRRGRWAVGGNQIYFMKPVDKADEKEYRMVWDCNRLESDEYEDVVISSPEKYAEKFVL